jgi:hypothetical protein
MTDRIRVSKLLEVLSNTPIPYHSDEDFEEIEEMMKAGYSLEHVCFINDLGGNRYKGEHGFIFIFKEPYNKAEKTELVVPYGPKTEEFIKSYEKICDGRPDTGTKYGKRNRRIKKIKW